MVALFICLFVLGVTGAVLRQASKGDGGNNRLAQRATAMAARSRDRLWPASGDDRQRSPGPARLFTNPPVEPMAPVDRVRASAALVVTAMGVGLLVALALGAVLGAIALALRAAVGA